MVYRGVLLLAELEVDRWNAGEVLECGEVAARSHGTDVAVPKISDRLALDRLVRTLHFGSYFVDRLVE